MMKKLFAPLCIAISTLLASCGSSLSPVEYNNKLMSVMNENEKHMNGMNTAMTGQDYDKAETVRKTWVTQLDKSIGEVDKIEAPEGGGELKSAVSQGLKDYRKILDGEYKTLIGLRTREKGGDTSVELQIQASLNKINGAFEAIGGKIGKAGTDYETKFNKP